MKPFFCYYGGKWRMAKHYPAPRYRYVIEPFAGAAGYSTYYGVRRAVLADADPVLAGLWKWLIAADPSAVFALPLVAACDDVRDMQLDENARHLIGFWLNKGSSHPCNLPSTWMKGGTRPNSYWGDSIRARLAGQVPAIKEWQAECCSYRDIPDVEATWFIDPPYAGRPGSNYTFGSNKIDYGDLADWCRTRRGQVIVCEAQGASWLPFRSLGDFQSNPSVRSGRSAEAVWP